MSADLKPHDLPATEAARDRYRAEIKRALGRLALLRESLEARTAGPNTNSAALPGKGWSVIPVGRPTEPVVMGLNHADAKRSAAERAERPSSRRGLNAPDGQSAGRYKVVSDKQVLDALAAEGRSLADVKIRRLRARETSRRSSARFRTRHG